MYPEQVAIINEFTQKFNSTNYGISKFIRNNRIKKAPQENKCTNDTHQIMKGTTIYIFNGKPYGLKSFYCSNMKCFLENIDAESVNAVKSQLKTKDKLDVPMMEQFNEENYKKIKN